MTTTIPRIRRTMKASIAPSEQSPHPFSRSNAATFSDRPRAEDRPEKDLFFEKMDRPRKAGKTQFFADTRLEITPSQIADLNASV